MKRSLNIALPAGDFLWGGGVELLRSLANALLSVSYERDARLFLLLPVRNKVDTFADLRGTIRKIAGTLVSQGKFPQLRREQAFDASVPDYFRNVDGVFEFVEYNEETGLVQVLRKIEADVVMPAATPLGESFPFPWVGYVYDFQHKYFPSYFSASECFSRDIEFATMLRDAKAVIVNARSVKEDIDKFYPYRECEVFNLPFSAAPVLSWLEDGDPNILDRYKLPPRYFLISNQFWMHKAHGTAFQALALLKDTDCADLHIVCTGKMEDYRFPDHIRNLSQEVSDLGIGDRVHFLGHIPKVDQIAIMKKSLAVLQPTLFEGGPGGGSVYDAVSLGVPAIVSDIPVNREIEHEENLFYFVAGSAADMADKIKAFLRKQIRRPVKEELISSGEQRKRLMGECLLEAVDYVRTQM
jgi:glycosyltransferase involved in cell wall biosynthesis